MICAQASLLDTNGPYKSHHGSVYAMTPADIKFAMRRIVHRKFPNRQQQLQCKGHQASTLEANTTEQYSTGTTTTAMSTTTSTTPSQKDAAATTSNTTATMTTTTTSKSMQTMTTCLLPRALPSTLPLKRNKHITACKQPSKRQNASRLYNII